MFLVDYRRSTANYTFNDFQLSMRPMYRAAS